MPNTTRSDSQNESVPPFDPMSRGTTIEELQNVLTEMISEGIRPDTPILIHTKADTPTAVVNVWHSLTHNGVVLDDEEALA